VHLVKTEGTMSEQVGNPASLMWGKGRRTRRMRRRSKRGRLAWAPHLGGGDVAFTTAALPCPQHLPYYIVYSFGLLFAKVWNLGENKS